MPVRICNQFWNQRSVANAATIQNDTSTLIAAAGLALAPTNHWDLSQVGATYIDIAGGGADITESGTGHTQAQVSDALGGLACLRFPGNGTSFFQTAATDTILCGDAQSMTVLAVLELITPATAGRAFFGQAAGFVGYTTSSTRIGWQVLGGSPDLVTHTYAGTANIPFVIAWKRNVTANSHRIHDNQGDSASDSIASAPSGASGTFRIGQAAANNSADCRIATMAVFFDAAAEQDWATAVDTLAAYLGF